MKTKVIRTDIKSLKGKDVVIVETQSPKEIIQLTKNKMHLYPADSCEEKREENSHWTFGEHGAQTIQNILDGNASHFDTPKSVKVSEQRLKNSVKRRKKYNEMNGELSVDRVLGGSLTPYRQKTKVDTKQRNVSFYLDLF